MNRTLGKILIIGGIFLALGILVRGVYYYPNDEVTDDSGLTIVAGAHKNTSTSSQSVGLPTRLIIPKIGVDAEVVHLGVTKSGNMAAPKTFPDVGWYKYGTIPGEIGSAVIAGHEDNAIATPAVFYDLHKLEIGDELTVVGEAGKELTFRVVKKEVVPYNLKGPKLEEIFNAPGKARLNLITCTGDWLPSAKTNDKRLVVFTELVS